LPMKLFVNHANIIPKAEASFGKLTPKGLEILLGLFSVGAVSGEGLSIC